MGVVHHVRVHTWSTTSVRGQGKGVRVWSELVRRKGVFFCAGGIAFALLAVNSNATSSGMSLGCPEALLMTWMTCLFLSVCVMAQLQPLKPGHKAPNLVTRTLASGVVASCSLPARGSNLELALNEAASSSFE